jgi:hypothetical protein
MCTRGDGDNNRSRIYTFNALKRDDAGGSGGGSLTLLMIYPRRGIRFHSPLPYYDEAN